MEDPWILCLPRGHSGFFVECRRLDMKSWISVRSPFPNLNDLCRQIAEHAVIWIPWIEATCVAEMPATPEIWASAKNLQDRSPTGISVEVLQRRFEAREQSYEWGNRRRRDMKANCCLHWQSLWTWAGNSLITVGASYPSRYVYGKHCGAGMGAATGCSR